MKKKRPWSRRKSNDVDTQQSVVGRSTPQSIRGRGAVMPPDASAILKENSGSMEWERRLEEQQGHRYHLQVHVKEAKEIKDNEDNATLEGELQNGINQHPWLDKQIFDGADPDVSPAPPLNSDARREYDNKQREQELEKQLRLENQLQNTNQPSYQSSPRPKGP